MSACARILRELADSSAPASDALTAFVAAAAAEWPGHWWTSLLDVDIAADILLHERWLISVLTAERPEDSVVALWFGLFESSEADREVSPQLYVAGTSRAIEERDWNVRRAYWPGGRYAPSAGLRSLHRRLAVGGAGDEASFMAVLGYSVILVNAVLSRAECQLRAAAPFCRATAVGFDAGDFVELPWPPIGSAFGAYHDNG